MFKNKLAETNLSYITVDVHPYCGPTALQLDPSDASEAVFQFALSLSVSLRSPKLIFAHESSFFVKFFCRFANIGAILFDCSDWVRWQNGELSERKMLQTNPPFFASVKYEVGDSNNMVHSNRMALCDTFCCIIHIPPLG